MMKRLLILLISVLLTLSLAGCLAELPSPDDSENGTTDHQEQTEDSIEDAKEPNQAPSQNPEEQTTQKQEGDDLAACYIEYFFYSVADLHTYVTTGSDDLTDYSAPPAYAFEDMLASKVILACGYTSLMELFEFDESLFDMVEASFSYSDSRKMCYRYYLDDVCVTVFPMKQRSLIDCYSEHRQETLTVQDLAAYSAESITAQRGHVLRRVGDIEVIYYIKDSVTKEAHVMMGDTYVIVNCAIYSDKNTVAQEFADFMTDEKTAAFAKLFSSDDVVLQSVIANADQAS